MGLHADAAPLYATWQPHVGWGTPVAVLVALGVLGPARAGRGPLGGDRCWPPVGWRRPRGRWRWR
ncbi:hypothetical protein MRQ36_29015 [Micromonospora sp. R77]|nr:hypothetical protein [Micromonospora sp. R77]